MSYKLSTQAQEVYDNVVKNLNPVVNGKKLEIANIACGFYASLPELEINPSKITEQMALVQDKMLWLFDQGVQRGIFQFGVFGYMYKHTLSGTSLGEHKILVFPVFVEQKGDSVKLANEAFGLSINDRLITYENSWAEYRNWDRFVIPHD